ncbi:MAG: hypothetical protein ABW136_01090 [Steroidobacteraceae bacterium]
MRRAIAAGFALTLLSVASQAATQAIVLSGLGGDPDYDHRFAEWNASATKALQQLAGEANVVSLSGSRATAEALQKAVQQLSQKQQREDTVVVLLIGHGTWFGDEYRFNLAGPDLTGAQLKALFDRLPAERQLVVNASSASGAVAEAWKRPGRIVVTATKTGGERNATRFPQHFVEALSSDKADRDKDQVVTAAEAFAYASGAVAEAFKADASMVTEHSRLEGGDAARLVVARFGNAARNADDPQLNALQTRQQAFEQELATLKSRKGSIPEDAYYTSLEPVLLNIARLGDEREAREKQLGLTPTGGTP